MQNSQTLCPATNQLYMRYSYAFLTLGNTALKVNESKSFTYPLGTKQMPKKQCCYLDACLGNQTCSVPNLGSYPCLCTPWETISLVFDKCGPTDVNLCW